MKIASLSLPFLVLAACAQAAPPDEAPALKLGKVLYEEDFSKGMDDWWVEGGQKVWVQDGALHMQANPPKRGEPGFVCTAWCKRQFPGDVVVEYDATVLDSAIEANNINFFLCYSHPEEGKTLLSTREDRADANYRKYHDLNGYIFTFLKSFPRDKHAHPDGTRMGRYRMRRCPGFQLLTETYADYCERGVTYHCKIVKKGGYVAFYVDGKKYLEETDPAPLEGGQIGLRTFMTYLTWDNIRVTELQ